MQRVVASARTLLRHREFLVVLGANVVFGLGTSFVSPFLSMFGTLEVGMGPLGFGVFMTITAVGGIVISTWLAHLSDTRFSRRALLLLGASAAVAGYVGYALVRDVVALTLIGTFCLGVASVTFAQLFAHARELLPRLGVPAAETPLFMNLFRMFFALAWTIGPAVAALTLQAFSYRGLFLTAAALHAVLLAVFFVCVPAVPPAGASAAPPRPLRALLAQPGVATWYAAFTLIFMAHTMSMMNLPLLMLHTLGGSERQVGFAFSLAPVFELPFMVWFGLLATRTDPARLIRVAVVVCIIYYAALAATGAPWHVYPLQVLAAAFVAVTTGVAITFFQDMLPGQPGAATNLYVNAMRLGGLAGYLLFGSIAATVGYRAVFVACALLCAAALALAWPRNKSPIR